MQHSFLATLQPQVLAKSQKDPKLMAALKAIESEDFHGVYRQKLKEFLSELSITWNDEYLDAGILALQQYYAVAILDWKNFHAVSKPLDPFWHLHMLFSADYRAFCDVVYGEYMDHDPMHSQQREKAGHILRFYDHTMSVMPTLFTGWDSRFYPEASGCTAEDMICFHFGNSHHDDDPKFSVEIIPLNQELYPYFSLYTSNKLHMKPGVAA